MCRLRKQIAARVRRRFKFCCCCHEARASPLSLLFYISSFIHLFLSLIPSFLSSLSFIPPNSLSVYTESKCKTLLPEPLQKVTRTGQQEMKRASAMTQQVQQFFFFPSCMPLLCLHQVLASVDHRVSSVLVSSLPSLTPAS